MRSGDPQATDRVGLAAVLLVVLALVGVGVVAVGAPVALLGVTALAVAGLAALAVMTARRARQAEDLADDRARDVAAAERQLAAETEARHTAESRLAWRTRLASLRRARNGEALVDPESGLLLEHWLPTAVETRIASGRRRLTPVAVVMVEVVEDVDQEPPTSFDAARAAELLQATVRECDTPFRLDEGGFAVVLEDTDDLGALLVTKRFGEAVAVISPAAVVRAGVACYPAHALDPRGVLDRADEALENARRWRQHRIEVAPADR